METVPLLHSRGLSVSFGGVHAVKNVDLDVARGQILGLIGPNGAGKTTLINAVTGAARLSAGDIALSGRSITAMNLAKRARIGIVRTFQAAKLFGTLTSRENVEIPLLQRGSSARKAAVEAERLLNWVGFVHHHTVLAEALPYGEQRRLAIARALAMRPHVLLLDEPAAGMTEPETLELAATIRRIRDEYECGVVVVEHDMSLIMAVSDEVQVLVNGETLVKDSPSAVRANPEVISAYLGVKS